MKHVTSFQARRDALSLLRSKVASLAYTEVPKDGYFYGWSPGCVSQRMFVSPPNTDTPIVRDYSDWTEEDWRKPERRLDALVVESTPR